MESRVFAEASCSGRSTCYASRPNARQLNSSRRQASLGQQQRELLSSQQHPIRQQGRCSAAATTPAEQPRLSRCDDSVSLRADDESGSSTFDRAAVEAVLHHLYRLPTPLYYWSRPLAATSSPPEEPGVQLQLGESPAQKSQEEDDRRKRDNFYANVGDAIRTLREEVPLLFEQDLTYDIYRKDIVFKDPRNKFRGLRNYKLIWWSLRFHGRIFFSSLRVDVLRVWQSEDRVIRMRWRVRGVPRVPWEAEGTFDGVSTYRLDSEGKIYEHAVDNVILRDPPMQRSPLFAGLNLIPRSVAQPAQQPCPGTWCTHQDSATQALLLRFSWVRLYHTMVGTASAAQALGLG